jgi:transmembrane sensor
VLPVETPAGQLAIVVMAPEMAAAGAPVKVQIVWRGEMVELAPPAAPATAAPARDRVAELLGEADALRRAGRVAAATRSLREIVRRHRRDPRAPAAAFTLGRLLLDTGDDRAAARAFADARALAPRGPLAEDALAREVEAWARAGASERARARARRYLELHPDGARAEAVRRHAE